MKIFFFIQNLGIGGVIRQLAILTDHLARRGHDVSVVALYPIDESWKLIWKSDSIEVRPLLSRKPTVALAAIALTQATLELRSLLKRESVQILYSCEGPIASFIAWLATRGLRKTKLIWGIRGVGLKNDLSEYDWKISLTSRLCKLVSASVPLMIFNSEAAYARYRTRGYRCLQQQVVDNGFDVDQFKPDSQARARIRSEWNIEDKWLIGIVGRIDPSKGHAIFLEAAALLAKERENVRFVCVGNGSSTYLSKLKLLSGGLNLTEILIWAGVRGDMSAVYNALDILCLSSYREGFPNVIGEAMACGVPCVVADVGDSAKIVGDKGIVVPPGDPQMLATGLEAMLLKLSDINSFEIRDRIVKHFTIEEMVDKTEKALIQLLP